jgi:hypothetical protein
VTLNTSRTYVILLECEVRKVNYFGVNSMAKETEVQRIKFDLPENYVRAIRARAAYDGVYPRDVVMAALEVHLAKELAEVQVRMKQAGPPAAGSGKGSRTKG